MKRQADLVLLLIAFNLIQMHENTSKNFARTQWNVPWISNFEIDEHIFYISQNFCHYNTMWIQEVRKIKETHYVGDIHLLCKQKMCNLKDDWKKKTLWKEWNVWFFILFQFIFFAYTILRSSERVCYKDWRIFCNTKPIPHNHLDLTLDTSIYKEKVTPENF